MAVADPRTGGTRKQRTAIHQNPDCSAKCRVGESPRPPQGSVGCHPPYANRDRSVSGRPAQDTSPAKLPRLKQVGVDPLISIPDMHPLNKADRPDVVAVQRDIDFGQFINQ